MDNSACWQQTERFTLRFSPVLETQSLGREWLLLPSRERTGLLPGRILLLLRGDLLLLLLLLQRGWRTNTPLVLRLLLLDVTVTMATRTDTLEADPGLVALLEVLRHLAGDADARAVVPLAAPVTRDHEPAAINQASHASITHQSLKMLT